MNSIVKSGTVALALMLSWSPFATADPVVTFTGEFTQVSGAVDTLGLVGSSFELTFEFDGLATFSPAPGALGGLGVINAPVTNTTLTIVSLTGSAITTDNDVDGGLATQVFQFIPAGLPMADTGVFTNLVGGNPNDFEFDIGASVLNFDDEFFIDLVNLPSLGDLVTASTFDGSIVTIPATQSVVQVDGFVNQFGVSNVSFTVVSAIPEPGSFGLMGLTGFVALARRRRM